MITLKNLADNYYSVFSMKPLPKVRHLRAKHNVGSVVLYGSAIGSKGMYTMEIELEKENDKVSYLSTVSYIHCTCKAFQYYVQDPLAKIGSTNPGTGHINKKINNPKQIAAPCKHLYSYILYIMSKGILNKVNMMKH